MIRKVAVILAGLVMAALTVRLKPDTTYNTAYAQGAAYDLVIRNGRVIDGTGSPWYRADVAIRGDTIVRIAPSITDAGDARHRRGRADRRARVHRHPQPRAREHLRAADSGQLHPPGRDDDHRRTRRRVARSARAVPRKARALQKSVNIGTLHRPGSVRDAVLGSRQQTADARRARHDARNRRGRDEGGRVRHEHRALLRAWRLHARSKRSSSSRGSRARYGGIHISHMRDEAFGVSTACGKPSASARRAGCRRR